MNSSAFKSLEPEKFHYTLLCVSPRKLAEKTRRNKWDAHKMTKWKRQRKEKGEEEGILGEREKDRVGREGKGIWGTETNTYKTHKHSCLSEFVHKFSNLSCSLQGDGKPKAKRKGVVSSWSRGGLGAVLECSRWYKCTQNVCEFWAGIVWLQLIRLSFVLHLLFAFI